MSSPDDADDKAMKEVDQDDTAANEAKALDLKNQGNDQLKIGHFLQAIGFYSDALEYSPTNAIILSNRAQAYIKVENYGLAMADASAALESDPKYAKAYYRRGSAQFALGHLKDAKKDFRTVCQLNPKSKDARAKLKACEKSIREAAFRKAIESEMTAPLSDTYDPNSIVINPDSYEGPNPISSGLTEDMELEASFFEPGKLPREFVLVSKWCNSVACFWRNYLSVNLVLVYYYATLLSYRGLVFDHFYSISWMHDICCPLYFANCSCCNFRLFWYVHAHNFTNPFLTSLYRLLWNISRIRSSFISATLPAFC